MSSTFLKIIACIFMLIDHIGFCLLPQYSILRIIGRIAFPIFAFQISVGYTHTHDKRKYTLRMLLLALVSQLPYLFFRHISGYPEWLANVGFTFFIALICLQVIDLYQQKKNFSILLLLLPLMIAGYLFKVEYSFYGILLVIIFYLFPLQKSEKNYFQNIVLLTIFFVYITAIYIVLFHIDVIQYYSLIALIPILLYNGKKGANLKYVFYIFYPLHLLILGMINYFFI